MIKASFKRIIAFLPYVGAYFLALGVAFLAVAFLGQNVLFKDGTFTAVRVAIYIPSDSNYNDAGFALVSNMDSVEESLNFIEYDSVEEVREAVENEDVIAGIIIPENFASGIFSGANHSLEIVFKSAETFDEHVVNDIMVYLVNDLGVGQACTQTVYELCDEYDPGIDSYDLAANVRAQELGYDLDRLRMFEYETIDTISDYTLTQKIAASAIVYVFLLSVFVFAYYCKGSNPVFIARARLSGISAFRFFLTEALSVAIMMYLAFALLTAGLMFTKIGVSALSFVYMIPVILVFALIVTGISYLFKSPVSAAYISFAAFTVLMYLAGGLLPLEFLPKFLQETAWINPLRYLIDFTMEAMF